MSVELLQDSEFDLEEYIANEFARAFGAAEEEAFCVGTGTNQPTGIFTANGGTVGVTVAYLYEHREEADHSALNLTLRSLLFGIREEGF